MNKETKMKKSYNLKATLISSLFLLVFVIILVKMFMKVYNTPITDTGLFQSNLFKIMVLFIISFFLLFMVSGLIGGIIGIIKGKMEIIRENKYIKKVNPYIYYRELPNTFGIGVTSLLFDSTIENYKDIVAVILDLCARKYLTLIKKDNKYIVKVLKNIDNNLLSNEKYILSMIIANDIKNINYNEWFSYCVGDGINLGLYYHKENKVKSELLLTEDIKNKRKKTHFRLSLILAVFFFFAFLATETFMKSLGYGIFLFVFFYIVLIVPFYLLNIITIIKNIWKQNSYMNYQNVMNNKLIRTDKGVVELQKLYSFKYFIKDFGRFASKKVDEVLLWDRYLSYAVVFGLTKEIMNSGYKELICNASFDIDNIDDINLYDIEVE